MGIGEEEEGWKVEQGGKNHYVAEFVFMKCIANLKVSGEKLKIRE